MATKFILAAVSLHNWLKKHDTAQKDFGRRYCPQGYVDYADSHGILHKGAWRLELDQFSNTFTDIRKTGSNNYTKKVLKESCHGNMSMYEEALRSQC